MISDLRPPHRKVLTRPRNNLKTRKAMNGKFSGYSISDETIIYWLLHKLHDFFIFNQMKGSSRTIF